MRKRIDWDRLVKRWRTSGLTQAEFCRREQVSLKSFHHQKQQREGKVVREEFVELTRGPQIRTLELVVGDGVVIRIPEETAPERIAELIRCLR